MSSPCGPGQLQMCQCCLVIVTVARKQHIWPSMLPMCQCCLLIVVSMHKQRIRLAALRMCQRCLLIVASAHTQHVHRSSSVLVDASVIGTDPLFNSAGTII